MPVDLFTGLTLLTILFGKIADSVKNIQGTPKRKLGKDLLELIKIFSAVEISVSNVVSKLNKFTNETDSVRRVQQIDKITREIDTLKIRCEAYIWWLRDRSDWIRAISVFSPDAEKALSVLAIYDRPSDEVFEWIPDYMYDRYNPIIELLNELQRKLQAAKNSDPKLSPEKAYTELVINHLNMLLIAIQSAIRKMRNFTSTHLTVDDIF